MACNGCCSNRYYGTYGYNQCWTGIYIYTCVCARAWVSMILTSLTVSKTSTWYQNCIIDEIMIFGEYLKLKIIFVYLSYCLGQHHPKPYWYYNYFTWVWRFLHWLYRVEWYWEHKCSQISIITSHMVQNMVSLWIEVAMWFQYVDSIDYWWLPNYG